MVLRMKFYTSLCKFSPNMVYYIFDVPEVLNVHMNEIYKKLTTMK